VTQNSVREMLLQHLVVTYDSVREVMLQHLVVTHDIVLPEAVIRRSSWRMTSCSRRWCSSGYAASRQADVERGMSWRRPGRDRDEYASPVERMRGILGR
jgi:hypothetical protein